jgi:hypothetical protein
MSFVLVLCVVCVDKKSASRGTQEIVANYHVQADGAAGVYLLEVDLDNVLPAAPPFKFRFRLAAIAEACA